MKRWPHQLKAIEQYLAAVESGYRNILITSPTGGGKSYIMRDLINLGGKSIVYTHRRMLLSQLADGLLENKIPFGYRASGYPKALDHDVQLAMVRSEQLAVLTHGNRERHPADMILVDEAHNNANGQTLKLLDHHYDEDANSTRIGLTATPLNLGHAYDHLIVAGTNSDLRACGAHVPAMHFGPDEPSKDLAGKIQIGERECGITRKKRKIFATRVFGSVIRNYRRLNPDQRPAILFAPGVNESIWFCEQLNEQGIPAAHICGKYLWHDGELHETTDPDERKKVIDRVRCGEIKILCNRFVLREGIDIREIYHCIFATVFGSLTAYLQAGGRVVRAHPSMDHVIVQDHGGNAWRFGSLNENRHWRLDDRDSAKVQERLEEMRENVDLQPIYCEKCNGLRMSGNRCHHCGHVTQSIVRRRPVLQTDGTLKPMAISELRKRKTISDTEANRKGWEARVNATRKSKKESVRNRTFSQVRAAFARDNDWQFPPNNFPQMPIFKSDWFRPVADVPKERLHE